MTRLCGWFTFVLCEIGIEQRGGSGSCPVIIAYMNRKMTGGIIVVLILVYMAIGFNFYLKDAEMSRLPCNDTVLENGEVGEYMCVTPYPPILRDLPRAALFTILWPARYMP